MTPASRPSLWSFVPWIAAAGLAALAGWASQLYVAARAENAMLRDQQRLSEIQLQSARNQIEAERILSQREIDDLRREIAEMKQAPLP